MEHSNRRAGLCHLRVDDLHHEVGDFRVPVGLRGGFCSIVGLKFGVSDIRQGLTRLQVLATHNRRFSSALVMARGRMSGESSA